VRITNTFYSGDMYNGILNFGELKVFNRAGENLALGQPSTMSSVYDNGAGERYCGMIVDPASNGNDGNLCSFASTDRGTSQWWQVDLGSLRSDLSTLAFYIRNDNVWSTYWSYRANGAIISLLDNDGSEIASSSLPSNVALLSSPFEISFASFVPSTNTGARSACAVISSATPSASAFQSAKFTPQFTLSSSPIPPSSTYVVIIVLVFVGLPHSSAISSPGSDFSALVKSAIAELLGLDQAAVEILSIGSVASSRRLSSMSSNDTSISFVLASPRASTAASLSSALSSGSAALASLTARVASAAGVSPSQLTASVLSVSTINVGNTPSLPSSSSPTPGFSVGVLASAIGGGALVLIIALALIIAKHRSHVTRAVLVRDQDVPVAVKQQDHDDISRRASMVRRPSQLEFWDGGNEKSDQSRSPKLLIRTPLTTSGTRSSIRKDDVGW